MTQLKIQAALELAVNNMPGLVPESLIVSSIFSTFSTVDDHNLVSGMVATISDFEGSLPEIDGEYIVNVTGPRSFTVSDVDTLQPINLTVDGIGGSIKAELTGWENTSFVPFVDSPYQRVNVLFGKPQNPSYGNLIREVGFMQVTLYYPKQQGTRDINTRVQMLKDLFRRGASFQFDGITVLIPESPEKLTGGPQDTSYVVAIRIPFWCDTYT